MAKVLIALGGNALGKTPIEQKEIVRTTAKKIIDLHQQGNKIIICHGNGPQVGMINNAFSSFEADGGLSMPFAECGSMSQGYIGYHIQNAIKNELMSRGLENSVVSLVTQVEVDKNSEAFSNPTKPIGSFLEKEVAEKYAAEKEWIIKEDSGRGWRRVVASPKPINIIESSSIKTLFENDNIVIAGGGGGIPVYKEGNKYIGIDAVIDKDFTAAKIAEVVGVDSFIILTAVDKVAINFNTPDMKQIGEIQVDELQELVDKKTFAEGSMKPKVEAVIKFVKQTGKNAFIGNLEKAEKVLTGESGTKIYK